MKPYVGERATRYEELRSSDPVWQVEQKALAKLLRTGPVLDAPVGTGRYIPIYNERGLSWTGLDLSADMIAQARRKVRHGEFLEGDIRTMDLGDRRWETVVCSRLVNWLSPSDMISVVQRLAAVSSEQIISIRTSMNPTPRPRGNQTHHHNDWMRATDGLHIDSTRRIHALVPGALFEMHRLVRPTMANVRMLFRHHRDGVSAIQRLTDVWVSHYGLSGVCLDRATVRSERWSGWRIGSILDEMSAHSAALITTDKPRRTSACPLIVVRSQGREWMIDGRRRSNLWRDCDTLRPVLVVEPC